MLFLSGRVGDPNQKLNNMIFLRHTINKQLNSFLKDLVPYFEVCTTKRNFDLATLVYSRKTNRTTVTE